MSPEKKEKEEKQMSEHAKNRMSGPWAINYTPGAPTERQIISEERFETAEDAFRWLEEQGVDYMEVLVDHVYEFFKDCNEGTCTSAGSCSFLYGVC